MFSSVIESFHGFFLLIRNDLIFGLLLTVCLLIALILNKYSWLNLGKNLDGIIGLFLTIFATKYMVLCSFIAVASHLIMYQKIKDPMYDFSKFFKNFFLVY